MTGRPLEFPVVQKPTFGERFRSFSSGVGSAGTEPPPRIISKCSVRCLAKISEHDAFSHTCQNSHSSWILARNEYMIASWDGNAARTPARHECIFAFWKCRHLSQVFLDSGWKVDTPSELFQAHSTIAVQDL
jgi:hypothetical protein